MAGANVSWIATPTMAPVCLTASESHEDRLVGMEEIIG
jgi:malate synthase